MHTRRQVLATGAYIMTLGLPAFSGGDGRDSLLDMLDLSRPELDRVREAYGSGDLDRARAEFAAHLRRREKPRWFIDPANPPKDITAGGLAWADRALDHILESVGIPHRFGEKIDWSYNPTTQPGSPYAPDHEWTWQLNRHGVWTFLASAYNSTGDPRYARELSQQLLHWIRDSPPPQGRALQSPFSRWRTIEAGIRMFSAWPEVYHRLLRHPDVFPDEVLLAMVECMGRHAIYLDAFPTSGNWLCMECNGLFHVGVLFPEFREAPRWRENALARLRRELDAQVYPDGAQFELTPGYHNVSLGNFVKPLELARLNDIPLPPGYQERLERMYDLFLKLMTPDRDVPPFNDSWSVDVRQTLEAGLKLFPMRSDWRWVAQDGRAGRQPRQSSLLFPYAGWAVMRSGWDTEALYLVMDCGPFGYGHQHEDKLSFVLHAFGTRLVFDAGSYAYDASPMRHYVLSARGHNVIHVDGLEQHRRGHPRERYVVSKPVPVLWHAGADVDYAAACYGRRPEEVWGPEKRRHVLHTRRVLFVKPLYWLVCDTLEPQDDEEHLYESIFHLDAPEAHVDFASLSVTAKRPEAGLSILPLAMDGLSARIISGQMEPFVQGWLPIRHGRRGANPRPCLYFSVRRKGRTDLLYVFAPWRAVSAPPVTSVEPLQEPGAIVGARVRLQNGVAHEFVLGRDGFVRFRQARHAERRFRAEPPAEPRRAGKPAEAPGGMNNRIRRGCGSGQRRTARL